MSTEYSSLKHFDLTKRGALRLVLFSKMVTSGDKLLTKYGHVIIPMAIPWLVLFNSMNSPGHSRVFDAIDRIGKRLIVRYPHDFLKTPEFGGKGVGFSTRGEDTQLQILNQKLSEWKGDKNYVSLKVGSEVYDVRNVMSTAGTPKSDFHLLSSDSDEVVWISHKEGNTARHFQQWSGLSARSEALINSHPETQDFLKELSKSFSGGVGKANTLYRPIEDPFLKNLAIYGNEFGNKYSRQNVTTLLQGNIELRESDSSPVLMSDLVHQNGEIMDSDYNPVFVATHRTDRSDCGIHQTRLVIMPRSGRKMKGMI
jgi:hypothetical protein